jgi:hypothetical protein
VNQGARIAESPRWLRVTEPVNPVAEHADQVEVLMHQHESPALRSCVEESRVYDHRPPGVAAAQVKSVGVQSSLTGLSIDGIDDWCVVPIGFEEFRPADEVGNGVLSGLFGWVQTVPEDVQAKQGVGEWPHRGGVLGSIGRNERIHSRYCRLEYELPPLVRGHDDGALVHIGVAESAPDWGSGG